MSPPLVPTPESTGRGAPRSFGPGVEIRAALDDRVGLALPPICLGLATVFGFAAVAESFVPDLPGRALIVSVSALSAGLCLSVWAWLRRSGVPRGMAHRLAASLLLLAVFDSGVHLLLTHDPRHTTALTFAVVGAGVFMLDRVWYGVVAGLGLLSWAAILLTVPVPDRGAWVYFGLVLVVGALMGAIVQHARIRIGRGVEELRLQDRVRQIELETALGRTEEARKAEHQARTELEQAVRTLQETEERFRRLADATFEGVLVHRDGRVLDANLAAARLLGRSEEDLLDMDLRDLVVEDSRDDMRGFMLRSPSSMEHRPEEVVMARPDGGTFPAWISGRPVQFRGGAAVVAVFRDISQQKHVEQMLERAATEAESNSRMKSAFLTNMSHELRTPLNAVIGFSRVLLKNKHGHLSERELDYVSRIASSGHHLLQLISDILDLSRIEAGRVEVHPEDVELGMVVEDVRQQVELQAQRKGLVLEKEVPAPLLTIETDRGRLQQILFNLVGNAIKFTDEGRVDIRVEADPEGYPRRIHVTDTGPGIPVEKIWEIFDSFQQEQSSTSRRHEGLGIGLAITKSLCDRLGYELRVESVVGEGSTFTVDFHPEHGPIG